MHLIRFFRQGFPTQFISLGVIGILLWAGAAWHPPLMPEPGDPAFLYRWLFSWLHNLSTLSFILGYCLVLFEAIWLNYLLVKHDLVPSNTSLVAFLYILFVSLAPEALTLTPYTISLLFVLLILQEIFRAYDQENSTIMMFIAGFYTTLASFFFLPAIFLYGFLLISILIFRHTGWRDWLGSLVGLITPFLFFLTYLFLTDGITGIWPEYLHYFDEINFTARDMSFWDMGILVIPFFLLIAGLSHIIRHGGEKTVMQRKKTIVLLWLFVWAGSTLLYAGSNVMEYSVLLAVGLSFLSTNLLFRCRKPFLYNLLLWMLLLAILVNTIRITWFV